MNGTLDGKVALVTGATAGIGAVTARELAKAGATVVVVARDAAKAEKTRAEIDAAVGRKAVEVLLADMGDMAAVRAAADAFSARHARLDLLVNNAGLFMGAKRESTSAGIEKTFAVNHLGPFLLTLRLLPRVQAAPAGRIVVVASDAHKGARLDLDDPNLEKGYSSLTAYANSKLCNILFAQELARRLAAKNSKVVVNSLHPGVIATDILRDAGPVLAAVMKVGRYFMITPEEGARTTLHLALSEEGGRTSGGYFAKSKPAAVKNAGATAENARRLWELSERLTGESY